MKPNKFDSAGLIGTFLVQFEICSQYNNWSSADKCAQLKCCLQVKLDKFYGKLVMRVT